MRHRVIVTLVLASGLLSAVAGYWLRGLSADRDLAECQRVHAEALAITMRAAREAEAEYRAREAQTAKLQQEALDAAHVATLSARADADRVRAALERLRRAAAASSGDGSAAANPPAAGASQAAGAPADLPPDLLWRLGQAAGELAAAADEARTAGTTCQRSYQALIDAQPRLGEQK